MPSMRTLILCTLFMSACGDQPAPALSQPPPQIVLRSYVVPGGQAHAVTEMLRDALRSDLVMGRVVPGPNGEVVVVAPEGIQQGVAALIEEVGNTPPITADNVELSYWLVSGVPGEASRPDVAAIAPALDAIEERSGPRAFTIVDTVTLTSRSGDYAQLDSAAGLGVEQTVGVTATNKQIQADVTMNIPGRSRITTRLAVRSGQVVVLAEMGNFSEDERGATRERADGTLYYVVRGTVQ